ncbi:hypothetical protein AWV80_08100 [Cupriavidus sp. UYMU48A]|nr:hypothetical protein AWV80_20535 [Cupriavidus sp. UYMU48A]KAF7963590.1 hypothetical protein AWV80_08100 [Cupriavidus sp. UYMU48A]
MSKRAAKLRPLASGGRRKAKGVVLVVALVLIIVISLLAAWSMRGSLFDERLAGNNRDHQVAFQAAELGLRFCEGVVVTGQPTALFNRMYRKDMSSAVMPLRPLSTAPQSQARLSGCQWQAVLGGAGQLGHQRQQRAEHQRDRAPATNGVTLSEAAATPRCFIEEIRTPSRVRNPQTGMPINIHYRITALGTGINAQTQVTLQSEVRQ